MITLIGLGPGDPEAMSRGAERALRTASAAMQAGAGMLFLRTETHPCVETLREWGLQFTSFDPLYETSADFDGIYASISERVIEAALLSEEIAYAVPGHPLFGERSVRLILQQAEVRQIPTRIVASGSFVEAALTAARVEIAEGCDVRDALTLTLSDQVDRNGAPLPARLDPSRGLLLFQVYDTAAAAQAKLALMRDYPDDWEVCVVHWAGVPGHEEVTRLPLYRLDRIPVDHLTSVYIPPLPPSLRRGSFAALVGVMARLRAPDGCPWDREQTHATLRRYLVEETYEAIEAIDHDDPDHLCEELGDVLLQVVFHAQLASEEGIFNIDDVTNGIVEKLVRRHPHVFGEIEVEDSAEVLRNWERIKREEKAARGQAAQPSSLLDGVPKSLPALLLALEISKRVVKVGFEWKSLDDVIAKLEEEWGELKAELAHPEPDAERVQAELGDLLFTVVQIARWNKIDPEDALRAMTARFSRRFQYIEQQAAAQGRALTEMTLEEMDALWDEAKRFLTPSSKSGLD